MLLIPWFELTAWEIPFPIIGSLKLQPFGILVAIGILVGSRVAEWRAERTGVPRHLVADFLLYTVFIGLVLCALLNVVMYEPEKLLQMGRAIASWFSSGESVPFPYPGLSSFGGFVGGTAVAFWYRQKKRVSLLVLGDIFCFAFPFAWVFGRMGCFVVHDHPGLVSDFFLAVDNYHGQGVARHDLGLYEVLWSAVMIPTVLWLGKKPRPWGFFIAFVVLAYAPLRFCLDFLREVPANNGDVRYFGFTPGQYLAFLITAVGVAVTVRVMRGPTPTLMLDGSAPPADAPPASEPKRSSKASRRS